MQAKARGYAGRSRSCREISRVRRVRFRHPKRMHFSALARMRQRVVHEGLQLGRLLPPAGVVQVEPRKGRREARQHPLQLLGSDVRKRKLLERVRQSDPLQRSLDREQRVADREIAAEFILDERPSTSNSHL